MIAARWGMLLVAALLILAGFGATQAGLQPSALRVAVTAVVGLLAPLCWPGNAGTPASTVLRVVAWSLAAACGAVLVLRVLGNPVQPFARIAASCAMLVLILIVAHAAVATLEGWWRVSSADALGPRARAGQTVAFALALLGAAPLWFGPAAELLSARHAWIIDAVVGASPLTHLAVAGGNDLLRNQWFYQHSNLAALQFSYPAQATLVWSYVAACAVLALVTLAMAQLQRRGAGADSV